MSRLFNIDKFGDELEYNRGCEYIRSHSDGLKSKQQSDNEFLSKVISTVDGIFYHLNHNRLESRNDVFETIAKVVGRKIFLTAYESHLMKKSDKIMANICVFRGDDRDCLPEIAFECKEVILYIVRCLPDQHPIARATYRHLFFTYLDVKRLELLLKQLNKYARKELLSAVAWTDLITPYLNRDDCVIFFELFKIFGKKLCQHPALKWEKMSSLVCEHYEQSRFEELQNSLALIHATNDRILQEKISNDFPSFAAGYKIIQALPDISLAFNRQGFLTFLMSNPELMVYAKIRAEKTVTGEEYLAAFSGFFSGRISPYKRTHQWFVISEIIYKIPMDLSLPLLIAVARLKDNDKAQSKNAIQNQTGDNADKPPTNMDMLYLDPCQKDFSNGLLRYYGNESGAINYGEALNHFRKAFAGEAPGVNKPVLLSALYLSELYLFGGGDIAINPIEAVMVLYKAYQAANDKNESHQSLRQIFRARLLDLARAPLPQSKELSSKVFNQHAATRAKVTEIKETPKNIFKDVVEDKGSSEETLLSKEVSEFMTLEAQQLAQEYYTLCAQQEYRGDFAELREIKKLQDVIQSKVTTRQGIIDFNYQAGLDLIQSALRKEVKDEVSEVFELVIVLLDKKIFQGLLLLENECLKEPFKQEFFAYIKKMQEKSRQYTLTTEEIERQKRRYYSLGSALVQLIKRDENATYDQIRQILLNQQSVPMLVGKLNDVVEQFSHSENPKALSLIQKQAMVGVGADPQTVNLIIFPIFIALQKEFGHAAYERGNARVCLEMGLGLYRTMLQFIRDRRDEQVIKYCWQMSREQFLFAVKGGAFAAHVEIYILENYYTKFCSTKRVDVAPRSGEQQEEKVDHLECYKKALINYYQTLAVDGATISDMRFLFNLCQDHQLNYVRNDITVNIDFSKEANSLDELSKKFKSNRYWVYLEAEKSAASAIDPSTKSKYQRWMDAIVTLSKSPQLQSYGGRPRNDYISNLYNTLTQLSKSRNLIERRCVLAVVASIYLLKINTKKSSQTLFPYSQLEKLTSQAIGFNRNELYADPFALFIKGYEAFIKNNESVVSVIASNNFQSLQQININDLCSKCLFREGLPLELIEAAKSLCIDFLGITTDWYEQKETDTATSDTNPPLPSAPSPPSASNDSMASSETHTEGERERGEGESEDNSQSSNNSNMKTVAAMYPVIEGESSARTSGLFQLPNALTQGNTAINVARSPHASILSVSSLAVSITPSNAPPSSQTQKNTVSSISNSQALMPSPSAPSLSDDAASVDSDVDFQHK